jgi:hypothetical protein
MHLQNLQFETHATLQDHCLIKDNVYNYNLVSLKNKKKESKTIWLFIYFGLQQTPLLAKVPMLKI